MATNGQKSNVAVVVDSAASFPLDMSTHPGLHIVPMRLSLNGKTYLDGQDLSPSQFYRMLKESDTLPSTSAPSPASFQEAFDKASEEAQSILCLTVAARFSASFDSAEVASRDFQKANPDVKVTILDSRSAAGGEGLIALEAWRVARQGGSLEKTIDVVNDVIPRIRLLAFLDTLYYLWKGGRVPRIAHAGASLLRIKPLFELSQGEVQTLARPRTHKRAMIRLLELMRERVEPGRLHATVMHVEAKEAAAEVRRQVEAEFSCEEHYVSEFTPTMGAHIGPGLLGIAFWSR